MDEKTFRLAEGIVSKTYIQQAEQARKQRNNLIKDLLAQRTLPEQGWDDASIEQFLSELSLMDSNNFLENVGVGEREGRVFSGLVARRNYNFAHGIGRSGELAAEQPKAAGSSLMYKLAQRLALDACRIAGLRGVSACLLLPVATGMSLTLTLLAAKHNARCKPEARYVIWPRIDQKSCPKAILAAGLTPLVVDNRLEGDEARTDLDPVEPLLATHGHAVMCVMSTTSCFAPRAVDRVVELAQLCKQRGVCHIVNNAYGLQSSKLTHLLSEAVRLGRVDAIVQSLDKNFMVPVGGALVASPDASFIEQLSKFYPGRASSSAVLDVFITLLSMGATGYRRLLSERKELFGVLTSRLAELALRHGERLLATPNNPISCCMSLSTFSTPGDAQRGPTFLGSMLFARFVSGTRTVVPTDKQTVVGPLSFKSYGAHHDQYPVAYLSAAGAIGMTLHEVDTFIQRLDKAIRQFRKGGHPSPSRPLPSAAATVVSAEPASSSSSGAVEAPSRPEADAAAADLDFGKEEHDDVADSGCGHRSASAGVVVGAGSAPDRPVVPCHRAAPVVAHSGLAGASDVSVLDDTFDRLGLVDTVASVGSTSGLIDTSIAAVYDVCNSGS
eukprot:TRINITY_DN2005_c1_g2_i2.p1 TRINITY_DN2005_c1_g2~~TRINITY_DN2005_c1_g2_i2.p1  ORF type:complete len:613 (+),score=180.67 TRINITY_DN2005_c1_g2_i2:866-2704(+)